MCNRCQKSHNFIGNIEANKTYVNYWKHVAKCLICKHQKYCSVHVHDTFVRVVVLIQVYNSQYNGKCLKILEVVQAIVMYINMLLFRSFIGVYYWSKLTIAWISFICSSSGSLSTDKLPRHKRAVNCFHQLALYGDLKR